MPDWLLLGGYADDGWDHEVPVTRCLEIDGLFADLPPRPRERFTLVGCRPEGALAEILDRLPAGTPWLDGISLTGTPPGWWGEDLADLVVLGRRPGTAGPDTVDIDLSGFVYVHDRTDAVPRPAGVDEFVLLGSDEAPYGTCRDVIGVFREQGPPPVPRVRLLGCRPEEALRTMIAQIGRTSDRAARRRRIRADVYAVAADGSAGSAGATVAGTVEACEPSTLGPGLLDVTIASDPMEPLPTGYRGLLEHWRTGYPTEPNLWAGHDREMRGHWTGVAAGHRHAGPDRPPGVTYHLDGRFVTDVEGFYCAVGEAVNGPGGYFGGDLDALADCCHGGSGATVPFRLVWHDSTVAREHLVPGYDHHRLRPAVTLGGLLDLLTENGVEVELR